MVKRIAWRARAVAAAQGRGWLHAAGLVLVGLAAPIAGPAAAQTVTLRVVIVSVEAIDDYDPGSDADHYVKVAIPGETRRTSTINEKDVVGSEEEPAWIVTFEVDPSNSPLPVRIELWDSDLGSDNHIDIGIEGGRDLLLSVELAPCGVMADITPPPGGPLDDRLCGQTILSGGEAIDRAALRFRVEVVLPPSTPGTNVECLHDPIRPQPGEEVEIRADVLDGAFRKGGKAATVEIFTGGQQTPDVSLAGVLGASHRLTVDAPSFVYGCLVRDGAETAWTGWRRVMVGDPPGTFVEEPAVPVLFVAPRTSAIDIVFVADGTAYSGADDPQFFADVTTAIEAYYGLPDFLVAQDRFNFWVSRAVGLADTNAFGVCDHNTGQPLGSGIAFADVHAILHDRLPANFRNCAQSGRRVFSASLNRGNFPGLLRHETGHRPFGLADEYCDRRNPPAGSRCDGGYFEPDPFPNLYEGRAGCEADAPNLLDGGVPRTAADCDGFDADEAWFQLSDVWYVSEPDAGDLMVDNSLPRAADTRRIEWLLDRCRSSDC